MIKLILPHVHIYLQMNDFKFYFDALTCIINDKIEQKCARQTLFK